MPKEISRTDGTRTISVREEKSGSFEIKVCKNGYQTTAFAVDKDMLIWLRDAIDEYLKQ